jgi:hypothetical protein
MRLVAGGAHDGDDLFDLGRIGWLAQTLVVRRVTGMESGQGRGRSTSTGTIEQKRGHGSLLGLAERDPTIGAARHIADQTPERYRFRHGAPVNAAPP